MRYIRNIQRLPRGPISHRWPTFNYRNVAAEPFKCVFCVSG